jgi:ribosomal protein S18 acetylase RimI-like enzyme
MAAIQITKATLSDLSLIKDISIQTFAETFAPVNSVQNIDRYIDENLNEIILRNELQNRSSAFYLAKVNDKVVGYLKLNWGAAQTETLADEALEIQRIYVLQEYQGQQIGQHLLLQAMKC